MLTLEGLGGLVPTLKFGSEMESTLHYANSDKSIIGVFPSDVIYCILVILRCMTVVSTDI
jgi:hypothetical protein